MHEVSPFYKTNKAFFYVFIKHFNKKIDNRQRNIHKQLDSPLYFGRLSATTFIGSYIVILRRARSESETVIEKLLKSVNIDIKLFYGSRIRCCAENKQEKLLHFYGRRHSLKREKLHCLLLSNFISNSVLKIVFVCFRNEFGLLYSFRRLFYIELHA